VVGADLLLQSAGAAPQPVVKNPREAAAYTFAYNDPLFSRRVHDALAILAWIRDDEHKTRELWLVGSDGMGPVAAATRARAGGLVQRAFVDTKGFRFAALKSYRDPDFLPGAIKYGDLPGILALSTPHPLAIAGETSLPPGAEGAVLVPRLEDALLK
jgi:hypothetical protein